MGKRKKSPTGFDRTLVESDLEYVHRQYGKWYRQEPKPVLEPRDTSTGWIPEINAPAAMTLTDIGKELGISKQAVEQIYRKALKKLRNQYM